MTLKTYEQVISDLIKTYEGYPNNVEHTALIRGFLGFAAAIACEDPDIGTEEDSEGLSDYDQLLKYNHLVRDAIHTANKEGRSYCDVLIDRGLLL